MPALIRFLLVAVVATGLAAPAAAETELADPPPSFDDPRKIVLQLATDDVKHINNILYNAVNIQKFYGRDNVNIAIVAFGPGMVALYKDDSPVRDRIESLLMYDMTFIACGNTMETANKTAEDLIEGVDLVQAGLPEIVERQLRGWVYLAP